MDWWGMAGQARREMTDWKVIEAELDRLSNNGRLTPDNVIDVARDENNPLHSLFEWDLDKAALEHWRQQARTIISRFTIRIDTQQLEVQKFIRDVRKGEEQGYVSVVDIKSDKELVRDTILDHVRIAIVYAEKVNNLAKYFGVKRKADHILEELTALQEKIQPKEEARAQ
jgi:hypothetical protein